MKAQTTGSPPTIPPTIAPVCVWDELVPDALPAEEEAVEVEDVVDVAASVADDEGLDEAEVDEDDDVPVVELELLVSVGLTSKCWIVAVAPQAMYA